MKGQEMKGKPRRPSKVHATPITTFDDGTFIRTAIVVKPGPTGSLDLVDINGLRIAQVNITMCEDGRLILDTIDVEERYQHTTAFLFTHGARTHTEVEASGTLVSADFKPTVPPKVKP